MRSPVPRARLGSLALLLSIAACSGDEEDAAPTDATEALDAAASDLNTMSDEGLNAMVNGDEGQSSERGYDASGVRIDKVGE